MNTFSKRKMMTLNMITECFETIFITDIFKTVMINTLLSNTNHKNTFS